MDDIKVGDRVRLIDTKDIDNNYHYPVLGEEGLVVKVGHSNHNGIRCINVLFDEQTGNRKSSLFGHFETRFEKI